MTRRFPCSAGDLAQTWFPPKPLTDFGRGNRAAARHRPDGAGGPARRRPACGAGPAAGAGRSGDRRRQRQFPRHQPPHHGGPAVPLHGHRCFGRRIRGAPWSGDHGRRRGRGLGAHGPGAASHRRPRRRRCGLRRPHGPGGGRPFRQGRAQRHRICRHADDRRNLRCHARRSGHGRHRHRRGVRPLERRRAAFLPCRDFGQGCRRH